MNKLLAAALVLFAGTASAQSLTTEHLKALDANGDGAVDSTELDTYMNSAFGAIDVDNDGMITAAEGGTVITPDLFGKADKNGDGKISRSEFQAQTREDFSAADMNDDGMLN
jgi:Ca2+-binding EF-hand superfamily protein